MLYGPRFGRFYLLARKDALAPSFLRLIGLADDNTRRVSITDPATVVARTRRDFGGAPGCADWRWQAGYTILALSRHVLPLRLTANFLRLIAGRVRSADPYGDIAVVVASRLHAVESSSGIRDCYPRALMSAFLLLRARRSCVLTIGALAPTRKMHIWCSTDGALLYEPVAEHYLYQPLWTMTLTL